VFDSIHLLNFEITQRYGQYKYKDELILISSGYLLNFFIETGATGFTDCLQITQHHIAEYRSFNVYVPSQFRLSKEEDIFRFA
jgi:hypothetical protein